MFSCSEDKDLLLDIRNFNSMLDIMGLQEMREAPSVSRRNHDVDGMVNAPGLSPKVINAASFSVKLQDGIEGTDVFRLQFKHLIPSLYYVSFSLIIIRQQFDIFRISLTHRSAFVRPKPIRKAMQKLTVLSLLSR